MIARKDCMQLVAGTLVEKVMGFAEAYLALELGGLLRDYLREHDLGLVVGADATMRILPGLVRLPDVSFVSWTQLPGRTLPSDPVPGIVPELAAEILSESNTRGGDEAASFANTSWPAPAWSGWWTPYAAQLKSTRFPISLLL